MKRLVTILAFVFASTVLQAQMTNSEITKYVTKALQSGSSAEQIGSELMSRGVTADQIKRAKASLQKGDSSTGDDEDEIVLKDKSSRLRKSEKEKKAEEDLLENEDFFDLLELAELEEEDFDEDEDEYDEDKDKDEKKPKKIFGHNIFKNKYLTFEPNENLATPQDYRLGPGDVIIVDIWGANEVSYRKEISPEGKIQFTGVGPVYLNGLTVKEADAKVRKIISRKFAGLEGDESQINLSLGEVRSINVNVMGEVKTPGTYRLSPFSTVFTAVYRAGGVSEIGTLRNISVVRAGKNVATADLYGYIFNGRSDKDVRLQEGDVIIVNPYVSLVDVEGCVKRPMFYEASEGETLEKILGYAGGFSGEAYKAEVNVSRRTSTERQMFTVKAADFASFALADGDSVSVKETMERFSNLVSVEGAVYHPGEFELGGDIATARQLIAHAGGILPEALRGRAVIDRELENLQHETIRVDLEALLGGDGDDVLLKRNDVLHVYSEKKITEEKVINIEGNVANPGEYPYAENTTIEDAILAAGGLLKGSSTLKVDVFRLVFSPKDSVASKTMTKSFTLSIKDGYVIGEGSDFVLQPYDYVEVRKSPGFRPHSMVTITGEIQFGGKYAIEDKNTRVSDIVRNAGGLMPSAYAKGASLVRIREKDISTDIKETGLMKGTNTDSLDFSDTYMVGLSLEKALKNPGSKYDIVLKEGDQIFIPEYDGTVRVYGAVMNENAVRYEAGKSKMYYVYRAGGFAENASKGRVYVINMNGEVTKCRIGTKLEPGCTIYVPEEPDKEKMNGAEIISMGSTAASLVTVMLYFVSMLRNL